MASTPTPASAELTYILEKEKVDGEVKTKLEEAGITTVRQFAALVQNADEMRALAKASFSMDDTDLTGKAKLARLICAWDTAKARSQEVSRLGAEAEVQAQPKVLISTDYGAMRKAFEDCFVFVCSP